MNNRQDWTPEEREQLTQELLELHFGCHERPEVLEERLKNEPALRQLQAEVLAQAEALKDAVHPEQPELELSLDNPGDGPTAVQATSEVSRRWWQRPAGRLTAVAAAGLFATLSFFLFERSAAMRVSSYQSEHLHLTVSGPKAVPAGAPWSFTVQTNDLAGNTSDCDVRWQAFDEGHQVLASGDATTTSGSATISLAANLEVPAMVEVTCKNRSDEVRQTLRLSTAKAGPLVHINTDRRVYRPGEPILLRAVILDRVTRLPLKHITDFEVKLLDARDGQLETNRGQISSHGVGGAWLQVPEGSAGGTHKIVISSPRGQFADETSEVLVRAFRNPQLQKNIVLNRKSYAPGARGAARVTAVRLGDNSEAAGATARGSLVIDGTEVWHEERPLGADGGTTFQFEVPKEIEAGAARFVAKITDGGVVETQVKPFPVPTGTVLVAAYPEGGELIAGVENGLYLECTDSLGRPIDTTGEILDGVGRRVVAFRTTHQGRVRTAFVPERDTAYKVRVAGQAETTDLPATKAKGIALRLIGDDIEAGAPMRMAVAGRGDGPWMLGVFCRGVLVGQTTLRAEAGELRTVSEVPLPETASGVLRATVFDRKLQPVAERLIRRHAQTSLAIDLITEDEVLSPGDRQTIKIKTRDETGEYTSAVVGLSCTDLAAAQQATEPHTSLVDDAMLSCDVRTLEDYGDFFLGNAHSGRNVDLLLGTRGWRRFIWRNDEAAKAAIADAGNANADILAREGFSQTPQVLSNLTAAKTPLGDLNRASRDANDMLQRTMWLAVILGLLALLAEVLALLLRQTAQGMQPMWRGITSLSGAVLLFVAGIALLYAPALGPNLLSARLSAPTDSAAVGMESDDFIGEAEFSDFLPEIEVVDQTPFDANAWNSAIGLGSGGGGIYGRRNSLNASTANFEPIVSGLQGSSTATAGQPQRLATSGRSPEVSRQFGQTNYRYAHQHQRGSKRRDFTPTIFWSTLIVTDEEGNASVSFDTTDAVTTWEITADAHAATGTTGRLGSESRKFTTQLPLQVEAKLPTQVSAGDRLLIPISVILKNARTPEVEIATQVGEGLAIGANAPLKVTLENEGSDDGRGRALMPIEVGDQVGQAAIQIIARAGRHVDRIQHLIDIAPKGFPHRRSAGGSVTQGKPAEWRLVLPADPVPGSGEVVLKVFPSPVAALTEGLEGILREPHGCFEQASSSNYPNTLVLNLIEASGDNVPSVSTRARELLPAGYAKITGYECRERGYEWFGNDPGHEALTAYGLLQFLDMANVYEVDRGMIDRTRRWLLDRRDGKGNYPHPRPDHHRFGGRSAPITNAYVTYALLLSGTPEAELKVEIDALVERITYQDPYELALIACALNLTERPEAAAARQQLADLQAEDGSLPGAKSSITMSGARDLLVETTGFAILAWISEPRYAGHVRRAMEYLQTARRGNGTFGATQATIVALRAITHYAIANRSFTKDGTISIFEGDRKVAERGFSADAVEPLEFELWRYLSPGEHTLRLQVNGGGDSPMPWTGEVRYHAVQPANDPDAATRISTRLRDNSVQEGETIALDVVIENLLDQELPTPMAIIGIPAGLELSTAVVEDLHKAEKFAFWELKDRELILYWRQMDPAARLELTFDLTARIPGRSTGPASRTYLYYTPDQKYWAEPLPVEVTATR